MAEQFSATQPGLGTQSLILHRMEAAEEELKFKAAFGKTITTPTEIYSNTQGWNSQSQFPQDEDAKIALGRKAADPSNCGGHQRDGTRCNKDCRAKICPHLSYWLKLLNSLVNQKCIKIRSLSVIPQISTLSELLSNWMLCIFYVCAFNSAYNVKISPHFLFSCFVFLVQNSRDAAAAGWRRWSSSVLLGWSGVSSHEPVTSDETAPLSHRPAGVWVWSHVLIFLVSSSVLKMD